MTALFDIEHTYRLRFLIHIHLGGFIFHFYHNAWWWWFMLAFTETLVIEMWTGFLCIFMSWWCLMLYVKVQYQKLMCKDRIISLWMSWFFWLLDNVWRYWPIWWGISLVSRKFFILKASIMADTMAAPLDRHNKAGQHFNLFQYFCHSHVHLDVHELQM